MERDKEWASEGDGEDEKVESKFHLYKPDGFPMSSRGLVFGRLIWHNSGVPIFLERFILPAFAAIVIIVALTNPMGLDRTQRITGAAAIILAAYFVSHTLHKDKEIAASPLVGEVQLAFMNAGQFWAVYQGGKMVSPVDAVLSLRVVNNGSTTASLDSISVELKRGSTWMPLRHIPIAAIAPFFGPFINARLVEILPAELEPAVRGNSDIGPGKIINGVQLFEYDDPSFINKRSKAIFRVTVRDTLRRPSAIESSPTPADSSDPYAQAITAYELSSR
jgi:hypothetical protein